MSPRWKFEIIKMAGYCYTPVALFYFFHSDFVQENIYYPYLKKHRPDLYQRLYLDDDDDVKTVDKTATLHKT